MQNPVAKFLTTISPFNYLPEDVLEKISSRIEIREENQNTILFTQSLSKVESLCVIQKGALEIYYDDGKQKVLQGFLSEGEMYGGISILLHNKKSIQTVRVHEKSTLLFLPAAEFLRLCRNYHEFSSFFTDTFGKRMLDRSYAAIISKSAPEVFDSGISIFQQKIEDIAGAKLISCDIGISIREAASIMSRYKTSALLITKGKTFTGIVTDKDFREKVVAGGLDSSDPVQGIMSSPLIVLESDTPVFEALFFMMDKKIKHLLIGARDKGISGIVTDRDIALAQGQSPMHLLQKISSAQSAEELFPIHGMLPQIIKTMIQSGARAELVNRLVTHVSDETLKKLVELAVKKLGQVPCPFVFMIMGSEGRREQTLKTDQDNAIVYANDGNDEKTSDYFLRLGEMVCDWLDKAGYTLCKGKVMAQNPKWCQPLDSWKEYFSKWIATPEPMALMHASIFFDFRCGYGDESLIDALREHLFEKLSVRETGLFYYHLAQNAMQFKPPLGFFRNFVVESHGKHKDAFDIKKAMTPIVDFMRLYALANKVPETNTLRRLQSLYELNVFNQNEYDELKQSYTYLMQLRFARQLKAILEEQAGPDNYIVPGSLSHIEQKLLKEIFSLIENFQQKLSVKFTGMA